MERRGVAVITGGGTGIGLASALALASAGFDIAIAGRRTAVLAQAAAAILTASPSAAVLTRQADVSRPDEAAAVIASAAAELGGIDVLVPAAASYEAVPILDMTVSQWDSMMNVALRGTFICAAEAARHMKDHGGGRIILLGSTDSVESEPEVAHYNAAKAGIKSLAHSMAVEFAPYGITVNAVGPGWVRTPMVEESLAQATPESMRRVNPLGRWGEPGEIASLVLYLATDAPRFLTGALLMIDGGQTAAAPMP